MPFSDGFQSFNHYQNSSFKNRPAQRDASSRNDEIYAAARREREAKSRGEDSTGDRDAAEARNQGEQALQWRDDLGEQTPTGNGAREQSSEGEGKPLPDFEMDARGNVYLKGGSSGGTRWWRKTKDALLRKTSRAEEHDVVR